MEQKINKFIYWTPRILSILFLVFLAMFSLDVFEEDLGFWDTLSGLLIHNIPVFVLAIVLWISWKREIVGGILFTFAGLFYAAMILKETLKGSFELYMISWIIAISGPALIVGILFLINWHKKRKKSTAPGVEAN